MRYWGVTLREFLSGYSLQRRKVAWKTVNENKEEKDRREQVNEREAKEITKEAEESVEIMNWKYKTGQGRSETQVHKYD